MTDMESVQSFRLRAREWIAANLTPEADAPGYGTGIAGRDEATWQRARELQARLYAGGFAGICFPREYGGLGLTPEADAQPEALHTFHVSQWDSSVTSRRAGRRSGGGAATAYPT